MSDIGRHPFTGKNKFRFEANRPNLEGDLDVLYERIKEGVKAREDNLTVCWDDRLKMFLASEALQHWGQNILINYNLMRLAANSTNYTRYDSTGPIRPTGPVTTPVKPTTHQEKEIQDLRAQVARLEAQLHACLNRHNTTKPTTPPSTGTGTNEQPCACCGSSKPTTPPPPAQSHDGSSKPTTPPPPSTGTGTNETPCPCCGSTRPNTAKPTTPPPPAQSHDGSSKPTTPKPNKPAPPTTGTGTNEQPCPCCGKPTSTNPTKPATPSTATGTNDPPCYYTCNKK